MLAGIPAPHTPEFTAWAQAFALMSEAKQIALLTSIMSELTSIETQKTAYYSQNLGGSDGCVELLLKQRHLEAVMLHIGVPVMYRDGVCYLSDR